MIKIKHRTTALFLILILQLLLLSGCSFSKSDKKSDDSDVNGKSENEETVSTDNQNTSTKMEDIMKIKVSSENVEVVFELNDSSVSKSFYEQLPLTTLVENYDSNEKIFELSQKLDESDVRGGDCPIGSIAYFSPWNNIAMYYGDAPEYSGLYVMGNAVEGMENIAKLTGSITITAYTENVESENEEKAPKVVLNSGYEMPVLGLGTYSLLEETCVDSVYTAIKSGYRLIDTAYMYRNEKEVGEGVRKAIDEGIITRDEIFITTKLYPNQYANPEEAIEEALNALDLKYIDLLLLHHPGTDDVKAYLAMEKYVEAGKIRSIGLSNYYIEELNDFLPKVNITPALVQNEIHPYYQENNVIPYIQDKGIIVEGWYPLGGRGHQKELLSDPVLVKIAENHEKSVAQIILRWNIQRNVIAIPGSSNPEHIRENIDIFDFELTDEEMKEIEELERNEKHDWY